MHTHIHPPITLVDISWVPIMCPGTDLGAGDRLVIKIQIYDYQTDIIYLIT